jgi:hypothetical protein
MSWDVRGIDTFGIEPSVYADMSHMTQTCSALGTIGALAVLTTGLLFWDQMVKNKIYMKILMVISLCDFFGTFSRIIGFANTTAENDDVCAFEAWIWYTFNRASWFYTFWMSITLLTHVTYGKIYVTFLWINIYTWVCIRVMRCPSGILIAECAWQRGFADLTISRMRTHTPPTHTHYRQLTWSSCFCLCGCPISNTVPTDVTYRCVRNPHVMWCDVMWCDVMWCDVMWCDVMWCDVKWCDVMWCDVMWSDVMWCDVMWCDVL